MDIHACTDRLAQLLEQRLDIRGAGFETKLRRAGRLLPRHLRRDGDRLVEAMRLAQHPRLGRQLDQVRLEKAANAIEHYLLNFDAWDRRRGIAVSVSTSILTNILIVIALGLCLALWRGLI
ncbi:hypothetical protein MUY21_01805 [Aliiroseovarius sp. S2029]|uniref:hypothetical protein n=1 Tax=Aliiroseovarius sp. S2029 TaxID=2936988 RepID=UPI0020BF0531|nr:hypothetical protein [Aliiroseovarius sp. S2029]MCK8482760.1 hypothetical protein [Aliiroseovarius sp. S2029]